jgi:hypothetical protein
MIDLALLPHLTIAFHAPKNTGKDTVARAFRDKVFHQQRSLFHLDKFALPLYKACSALTGWPVEQLEDETTKEVLWTTETAPTQSLVGWSPRTLLEFVGTDVVRDQLGANHWVELMRGRIAQRQRGITVITDCRFVNEAQACDAVIELRRDGVDYDDGHVSRRRLPAGCITATYCLKPREEIDWPWLAEAIIVKAQRNRDIGR